MGAFLYKPVPPAHSKPQGTLIRTASLKSSHCLWLEGSPVLFLYSLRIILNVIGLYGIERDPQEALVEAVMWLVAYECLVHS